MGPTRGLWLCKWVAQAHLVTRGTSLLCCCSLGLIGSFSHDNFLPTAVHVMMKETAGTEEWWHWQPGHEGGKAASCLTAEEKLSGQGEG